MEGIQLSIENVKNFATFPWAKASKEVDPIFPRKEIQDRVGEHGQLGELESWMNPHCWITLGSALLVSSIIQLSQLDLVSSVLKLSKSF